MPEMASAARCFTMTLSAHGGTGAVGYRPDDHCCAGRPRSRMLAPTSEYPSLLTPPSGVDILTPIHAAKFFLPLRGSPAWPVERPHPSFDHSRENPVALPGFILRGDHCQFTGLVRGCVDRPQCLLIVLELHVPRPLYDLHRSEGCCIDVRALLDDLQSS